MRTQKYLHLGRVWPIISERIKSVVNIHVTYDGERDYTRVFASGDFRFSMQKLEKELTKQGFSAA